VIIHWLVPGNFKTLEDLSKSNLASIRMRAGLVGRHADKMNMQFSAGDQICTAADVIVVGKIGADCLNGRASLWIKQLYEAKQQSKKIILDYTDHHLESISSPMGIFYKDIMPIIDIAIVPSSRILTLLTKYFNNCIIIIEDPIEIEVIPPKELNILSSLNLLWFGHSTNIIYLLKYLQNSKLCDISFNLFVLSNFPGLEMLAKNQSHLPSSIQFSLTEWSLQNMITVSKNCHGSLIPSDPNDSRKSGASSNRLITSFALGLPVSADLLDSYAPFSEYFHNIRKTPISVFINQISLYSDKVKLAQKSIVPNFTEEAIAQNWRNFFFEKNL
jgi:hypothetical protein